MQLASAGAQQMRSFRQGQDIGWMRNSVTEPFVAFVGFVGGQNFVFNHGRKESDDEPARPGTGHEIFVRPTT